MKRRHRRQIEFGSDEVVEVVGEDGVYHVDVGVEDFLFAPASLQSSVPRRLIHSSAIVGDLPARGEQRCELRPVIDPTLADLDRLVHFELAALPAPVYADWQ